MRLFNWWLIPRFIVRLRNRAVDRSIERTSAAVAPQRFPEGLDERGLLKIEEKQGPVYPPILQDLEATLTKYREQISEDVLRACAKDIDGYRGFVHMKGAPAKTLEFFYPHGEVYVMLPDEGRAIVKTTLHAKFLQDGYEVVAQLLYNLEDTLFAPLAMAAE